MDSDGIRYLKKLFNAGVITKEEYDTISKKIIDDYTNEKIKEKKRRTVQSGMVISIITFIVAFTSFISSSLIPAIQGINQDLSYNISHNSEYLFAFLVLTTIAISFSCSNKDENKDRSSIIGLWFGIFTYILVALTILLWAI